jgi:RNA polymerase sigma-70 factor (ECF subfamily)
MTHAPSDHELLQRFMAADQEAFAVLVARHQGVVRTACARQAMPGDRDDCVQAVFLVLARRPGAALRAGNLPGWLVRTAWFVCRHARRAAVRRQHAERDAAHIHPVASASTESEALSHLDDCLQRLPARQRAAVTLHYLAGHPADEVATQLGVSRDNAYQLLSRGLNGLRGLLARRGVALSVAALGALLGGQAQAAAVFEAGTAGSGAIGAAGSVATLCSPPSPAATAFAHGAMTTMTITTATPYVLAASLLLATGLTTAALTAEHAPPVTPRSAPTTVVGGAGIANRTSAAGAGNHSPQADAPAWRRAIEQKLEQEVTLHVQNQNLAAVVTALKTISQLNIVIDPGVISANQPPITLGFDQMKLRYVLDFLMKMTSLNYSVRDEAIYITQAETNAPAAPAVMQTGTTATSGLHLEGATPALQERLAQRVTFDFQDTPGEDVFTYLRQVTGTNLVIAPSAAARAGTLTLRVKDMPLTNALDWIAQLFDVAVTVQDGALFVSAPAAPPADGQQKAAAAPAAAPAHPEKVAF